MREDAGKFVLINNASVVGQSQGHLKFFVKEHQNNVTNQIDTKEMHVIQLYEWFILLQGN